MLTVELITAEKADLEKELASYENKKKRLSLLVELLKTYGADPAQQELPMASVEAKVGRFTGMGTTAAILAFLAERYNEFFTSREIASALEAGGLGPTTPNFATTVYTNCVRKVEAGELEVEDGGKIKKFRLAPRAQVAAAAARAKTSGAANLDNY